MVPCVVSYLCVRGYHKHEARETGMHKKPPPVCTTGREKRGKIFRSRRGELVSHGEKCRCVGPVSFHRHITTALCPLATSTSLLAPSRSSLISSKVSHNTS
mmetsp:Transcript_4989/g.8930  ORF Transcript_4989/g.8930 Transcript_4989/m.8930 type:complete len:101 (+) Transcript_4989:109-411(+)